MLSAIFGFFLGIIEFIIGAVGFGLWIFLTYYFFKSYYDSHSVVTNDGVTGEISAWYEVLIVSGIGAAAVIALPIWFCMWLWEDHRTFCYIVFGIIGLIAAVCVYGVVHDAKDDDEEITEDKKEEIENKDKE